VFTFSSFVCAASTQYVREAVTVVAYFIIPAPSPTGPSPNRPWVFPADSAQGL